MSFEQYLCPVHKTDDLVCGTAVRLEEKLLDDEIKELQSRILALESSNLVQREALKTLYDETADYIKINHLGDVHHNKSMQMAREALSSPKNQGRRD